MIAGDGRETRTLALLVMSQVLCHLSYPVKSIIPQAKSDYKYNFWADLEIGPKVKPSRDTEPFLGPLSGLRYRR